jgi:hypothetical protein
MSDAKIPWYAIAMLIDVLGHRKIEELRRKNTGRKIIDDDSDDLVHINLSSDVINVGKLLMSYNKGRNVIKYLLEKYDMIAYLDDIMPDISKYLSIEVPNNKLTEDIFSKLIILVGNADKVKIKLLDYESHIDYLGYVAHNKSKTLTGGNNGGIEFINKELVNVKKIEDMINKFNYQPYDVIKRSPIEKFVGNQVSVKSVYDTNIGELNNDPIYDKMIGEIMKEPKNMEYDTAPFDTIDIDEIKSSIIDKFSKIKNDVDVFSELLILDKNDLNNLSHSDTLPLVVPYSDGNIETIKGVMKKYIGTLINYEPGITDEQKSEMDKIKPMDGGNLYDKNTIDALITMHNSIDSLTSEYTDKLIDNNIKRTKYDILMKDKCCDEYYEILFKILRKEKHIFNTIDKHIISYMNIISTHDKEKNNELMRRNLNTITETFKKKSITVNISGSEWCFNIITMMYYYCEDLLS